MKFIMTGIGCLLLLLLGGLPLAAQQTPTQEDSSQVYQLSGMVLNRANALPVSYTKIIVNSYERFALCNQEGFFSLPVVAEDTLHFIRVGYKPSTLIISEYLEDYETKKQDTYIYEIHYLIEDTITLPTVTIHPYETPADLKNAILTMSGPIELSLEDAQGNISPELVSYLMENLPDDEAERLEVVQRRYVNLYTNSNVLPNVTLMDPIAVYNLIRYIGNKSRRDRDRNLNFIDD